MPAKIPATVVTGFLGAGKTTLIRHLLANANGRRIALVINEFGDLGIDGEILKGCGDAACDPGDIVELSNGCICCTVAEDFIPTMERLIARDAPPDHIVIETSGLALPQPLLGAFAWPAIRTRVTLDGVLAVVDGPALAAGRFAADAEAVERQRAGLDGAGHAPIAELFEDQLASADMIVVNKTDLLGAPAAAGLAAGLGSRARPGVRVIAAEQGRVDPRVALGLGIGAEDDLAARAAVHHRHDDHDDGHDDDDHHGHDDDHGHDDFASAVIELPEIADREAFLGRLAAAIAAGDVLRVKGFAAVAGKPMRLVIQAVGPRIDSHFDRPLAAAEPRGTRLVAIGRAGFDAGALRAALA